MLTSVRAVLGQVHRQSPCSVHDLASSGRPLCAPLPHHEPTRLRPSKYDRRASPKRRLYGVLYFGGLCESCNLLPASKFKQAWRIATSIGWTVRPVVPARAFASASHRDVPHTARHPRYLRQTQERLLALLKLGYRIICSNWTPTHAGPAWLVVPKRPLRLRT